MFRRWRGPAIVLAGAALAGAGVAGQEPQPEYTLKARFLLQFPEFVAWPPEAGLGDASKPFVLLVLGTSPFEHRLDEAATSRKVKGHPVKIVYSDDPGVISGCQMVFICASEKGRLKEIMAHVGNRPVLTVGDTEGFGKKGVMINLAIEDDLPRFEINLGVARWNNLGMSAQLLSLARKVW